MPSAKCSWIVDDPNRADDGGAVSAASIIQCLFR